MEHARSGSRTREFPSLDWKPIPPPAPRPGGGADNHRFWVLAGSAGALAMLLLARPAGALLFGAGGLRLPVLDIDVPLPVLLWGGPLLAAVAVGPLPARADGAFALEDASRPRPWGCWRCWAACGPAAFATTCPVRSSPRWWAPRARPTTCGACGRGSGRWAAGSPGCVRPGGAAPSCWWCPSSWAGRSLPTGPSSASGSPLRTDASPRCRAGCPDWMARICWAAT